MSCGRLNAIDVHMFRNPGESGASALADGMDAPATPRRASQGKSRAFPWSSQMFTRRLLDLAGEFRLCARCRHLFPVLLATTQPRSVLDIGCGTGIALIDAAMSIRRQAADQSTLNELCLVGQTSLSVCAHASNR